MAHALIVNGSPHGREGNTVQLLSRLEVALTRHPVTVEWIHLAESHDVVAWEAALRRSQILVFGTGTYWDSWGSPLQRFLELMTYTEGSDCWLGKPAGVVVTMHSVGGKAIVSRLLGVLNTMGALIPPMCGLVYSAIGEVALKQLMSTESEVLDDLWRVEDLEIVANNLWQAHCGTTSWSTWPVDQSPLPQRWI